MDQNMLLLGAVSGLMLVLGAWGMLREISTGARIGERLRGPQPQGLEQAERTWRSVLGAVMGVVGGFGAAIARSGLLSRKTMAEFQQTLAQSGMSSRISVQLFVGAKLLLLFALPGSALLLSGGLGMEADTAKTIAMIAGIAGLLGPDMVVKKLRTRYTNSVEEGVADMLDLMLICAQSGLALHPALVRVEVELRPMYPQLAWELAQTVTELQIIADSRVALTNLGTRSGVETLRRLTSTLAQTLQYGTPLSEALRGLSNEMRQVTLTRFEEKAARLPVLLTIPMIIFILPCVFIIVGGPAVIQLIHNFG